MVHHLVASMLLLSAALSFADDLHLYQNIDYSPEMLQELSLFELCLLRNEVFANHGYIFSSGWLDAHFKAQRWYSPVEGCCSGGNQFPDFSSQENRNIQLFREMEDGLGRTIYSCWTRENTSLFDYEYYREVTSQQPAPSVFDGYNMYTEFPIELGSNPCLSSEDLLPFEQFSTLYDYSSDRNERMDDDYDFERAQEEILELAAAEFDLQDYGVYRVFRRPSGSIARIDKIRLQYGPVFMDPFPLWSAYFNADGNLAAYIPTCTWTTKLCVLLYGTYDDRTVLRAVIRGNYMGRIEMEVFEGTYPVLPFTVILCNEDEDYYMLEESRFLMLIEH